MKNDEWNEINPIQSLVRFTDGPIFVCVPTPMEDDGTCHTHIVEKVVREVSESATYWAERGATCGNGRVVCIKSTVIPKTTVRLDNQYVNIDVCFNPEFLTEVNALEDFKNQDRIVLGGSKEAVETLKQMYTAAFPNVPIVTTESITAEMVKYVTNCFLAVKVSFANEIKQACDYLNIDYDEVLEYATMDDRLGKSHWAVPGPDKKLGFGKACLPKDLSAMIALLEGIIDAKVMKAAWNKNIEVRPEMDWKKLIGRATISDIE